MAFIGFTQGCLRFIAENHMLNDKEWFHNNRGIYDEVLIPQLKELVTDLTPLMLDIDARMEVTPRINKTLSRINRDIRYSHDKSIYNDHLWLKFYGGGKSDRNNLGFWFGLYAESYGLGMGMHGLTADFREAFREQLKADEAGFMNALSSAYPGKGLNLGGDSYKRVQDADVPESLQPWSQFKEFYLSVHKPVDDILFGPELVEWIAGEYENLRPLYSYLKEVRENMA